MATYDKLTLNIPPFQEGNIADFEINVTVPASLAGCGASMEVRTRAGTLLFRKKTSAGTLTIAGQKISGSLDTTDTLNRAGVHNYELDILNAQGKPFATIGGTFTITAQINKNG